ncbi:hypothetical protein Sros01_67730 [Streptomyces roseochromogenus]|nr:hypothetical protein Sros01_67730 [Streptomyces roseochromogenus]
MGTFRNKRPYAAEGFPAPISSEEDRVLLWDGEQTAAYFAGAPVPDLPTVGEDDLSVRHGLDAPGWPHPYPASAQHTRGACAPCRRWCAPVSRHGGLLWVVPRCVDHVHIGAHPGQVRPYSGCRLSR